MNTSEMVVHDFTNARWGHSIGILRKSGETTYFVQGHSEGRIAAGHFLKLHFASGKQRLLKADEVEYYRDPPDMFKATISVGKWSRVGDEEAGGAL